jgi:hypothetical protein
MLDKSKAELWFASFRGDCPIHEAAQGGHCGKYNQARLSQTLISCIFG